MVDRWGGTAAPAAGRPWERDTLQVVYSTTEAATAVCALLLVQRGELDLDVPVATYWPEFAAAGKQDIPVRWLLTHQAGLAALDRPVGRADALAWHPMTAAPAARRPLREPGTRHGSTPSPTAGSWLVGEVVRRITGRGLGTFFPRRDRRALRPRLPYRAPRGRPAPRRPARPAPTRLLPHPRHSTRAGCPSRCARSWRPCSTRTR